MEKQRNQSGRKDISGGTVFDYVQWRGDLSFAESPWNEIDSVIASLVSYANFGENELTFESGQKLRLGSLASSGLLERFPQDGRGSAAEIRNRFLLDLAEVEMVLSVVSHDVIEARAAGMDREAEVADSSGLFLFNEPVGEAVVDKSSLTDFQSAEVLTRFRVTASASSAV